MVIRTRGRLEYFEYPRLSHADGLAHCVFTRRGGVSPPPFHSLNLSYAVGDRPEDVSENLAKVREVLGADRLAFTHQAHGADILIVGNSQVPAGGPIPTADAMITGVPGKALLIKQADCQAVILFDPERRVLANVHCGWRGNVRNILSVVVSRMKEGFGCEPSDLLAAVGPSLGPCCAEFVTHQEIFPPPFREFMVRENHFDLWSLSSRQLTDAGLKRENIEVAGICTRCRTDLFYSYRGEGVTGRFGTVAMIQGEDEPRADPPKSPGRPT